MQRKEGGHDAPLLLGRIAGGCHLLAAGQLGVGKGALHSLPHPIQQLLQRQLRPCIRSTVLPPVRWDSLLCPRQQMIISLLLYTHCRKPSGKTTVRNGWCWALCYLRPCWPCKCGGWHTFQVGADGAATGKPPYQGLYLHCWPARHGSQHSHILA